MIATVLIDYHRQQIHNEFDLRIGSVIETAAQNMELAVMIKQIDEIERMQKGLLSTPDLVSIAAYDVKGELLSSESNGYVPPEMMRQLKVAIKAEPIETGELQEPVSSSEGEIIGSIEAVFSVEKLESQLDDMLKFASHMALIVIGISVLLGYFFASALTGPLARLVDATQKVAAGDLTQSVKSNSKDEIGRLSDSFDVMVEELADDVARRIQTEQALRKSEQRFQALANKAPVGIFQSDKDGAWVFVNPKCLEILGIAENKILAHGWLEQVHITDKERVSKEWNKAVTNHSSFYLEFRFLHPYEAVTWVIGEAYPELGDDGEVRGIIGTIADVTALKIVTEELKRSNEELDSFARIASHDLKEPMRKIQSFGSILEEDFSDALGEKGRNYLDRVINAAKRMQGLIDGLLLYSRVTTKAQPFNNVDLMVVTNEVLSDLEVSLSEADGKVEFDNLPIVLADPLQIRQLMQNLLGNSIKYHRKNVPPIVKIKSRIVQEMAEITVEDNGIGFDEQHADRIFGVFERLHGRTDEYEGTGVGLSICKKIVDRHGGEIHAHGKIDEGAKFVFTLSLATREPDV